MLGGRAEPTADERGVRTPPDPRRRPHLPRLTRSGACVDPPAGGASGSVKTWVSQCLAAARAVSSGVVIVLDRDRLVEAAGLPGDVVFVDDWWSLRRAYERDGRRRAGDRVPLVVVISGDLASTPLPWD